MEGYVLLIVFFATTQCMVFAEDCCQYDWSWKCLSKKWRGVCTDLCANSSNNCPKECFVLEDICVKLCPEGSFVDYDNPGYCHVCPTGCRSCYGPDLNNCEECDEGYFSYNMSCFQSCPHHMVGYNHQCIKRTACIGLLYNSTCVNKCPFGYFGRENICEKCDDKCLSCANSSLSCTSCKYVQFESKCLNNCPDNAIYNFNGTCVANCPFFSYNETCVEKCELYIFNKKCVQDCPSTAPYTSGNVCVSKCPALYLNHTCQSDNYCPRGYYILGKECVKACPMNYPFIHENFTCLKTCPDLIYEELCLNECPYKDKMVIFNRTCLLTCPVDHPVIEQERRICLKECNEFSFEGICLRNCPNGTFPNNKTCETCSPMCNSSENCIGPLNTDCTSCAYLNSSKGCVQTCPDSQLLTVDSDHPYCTSSCPINFLTDNVARKCVEHCPNERKYISNLTKHSSCVASCPEDTFESPNTEDNFACLSQCPQRFYQVLNTCEEYCPQEYQCVYNNTCSKSCPAHTFELHSFGTTTHCVDSCSGEYTAVKGGNGENGKCVDMLVLVMPQVECALATFGALLISVLFCLHCEIKKRSLRERLCTQRQPNFCDLYESYIKKRNIHVS